MHPHAQASVWSYLIAAAVFAVVMAFRLRRMRRSQPLKLERLWIIPALLVVMMALALTGAPPHGLEWLFLAAALAGGAALGWVRGSTMAIVVDPETHALNMRASPAAIILLVVLVVIRFGLRSVLSVNAGALHLSAVFIGDLFLVFAVGVFTVQRIEMALRARRLLAAARGL